MEHYETQIRLLRFGHGDDDEDIAVNLQVHDRETCPPYIAISYTWGDHLPTVNIAVDGHTLPVRSNCWYTLWQMRRYDRSKAFWIDSICIDQSNVAEKNAQVANMGSVYSKAAMTACCLGPGNNLAAVQRLKQPLSVHDTPRTLLAEMNALRELQHRSYFRRMWIKQEIIRSKHVRLFCGVDSLDWDIYAERLDNFRAREMRDGRLGRELHPKSRNILSNQHSALVEGRKYHHSSSLSQRPAGSLHSQGKSSGAWTDFWTLLQEHGDAECTDPHDKVYAVVPILPETTQRMLGINIDYSQPLLDLCLWMFRSTLLEFKSHPDGLWKTELGDFYRTMTLMVEHWLHLRLSDAYVDAFVARWLTWDKFRSVRAKDTSQSSNDHMSQLQQPIEIYAPLEVWWRIKIEERRPGPPGYQEVEYARHYESEKEPLFITETMLAGDVKAYILAAEKYYHELGLEDFELSETEGEDFNDFVLLNGAKGNFTLSGLPADTQVKLLFPPLPWERSAAELFLVSPNTAVGDQILACPCISPRDTSFFLPVMRPVDQKDDPGGPSVLIGWAVMLRMDGSLHRGLQRPSIEKDFDVGPPVAMTFQFYWEDLVLETILRQDAARYVRQACTHSKFPSFVSEDGVDELESSKRKVSFA